MVLLSGGCHQPGSQNGPAIVGLSSMRAQLVKSRWQAHRQQHGSSPGRRPRERPALSPSAGGDIEALVAPQISEIAGSPSKAWRGSKCECRRRWPCWLAEHRANASARPRSRSASRGRSSIEKSAARRAAIEKHHRIISRKRRRNQSSQRAILVANKIRAQQIVTDSGST